MHTETILVILLSIGFIILLALAVIVLVTVLKIVRSLQRMTERAEVASQNMAEVMKTVGKQLAPGVLAGLVGAILRKLRRRRSGAD